MFSALFIIIMANSYSSSSSSLNVNEISKAVSGAISDALSKLDSNSEGRRGAKRIR